MMLGLDGPDVRGPAADAHDAPDVRGPAADAHDAWSGRA